MNLFTTGDSILSYMKGVVKKANKAKKRAEEQNKKCCDTEVKLVAQRAKFLEKIARKEREELERFDREIEMARACQLESQCEVARIEGHLSVFTQLMSEGTCDFIE